VLLRVQSGLRIGDACVLIGLQRRQVFRLLRDLKQDGPASLLSKRRGRPRNHRLPAEVRNSALSIARERYADFGPTLAAEKLTEHHGCSVSRETLRGWMIADGRGRTVGIVFPSRTSRAGGAIAWANWCRSTARNTPGSRTAVRRARCWLSSMMRRAD
jgi:hypothetical protein